MRPGRCTATWATAGPAWLRTPEDVNALVPQLWPRTVTRAEAGCLRDRRRERRRPGGRVRHPGLLARRGRSAGPVPRVRGRVRATPTSTTRASRSCARRSCGSSRRRGSSSTSAPAGSWRWRWRRASRPERIGFHGNNKSASELSRALEAGVGRIIVDSFDEIDRLTDLARRSSGKRPSVLVRVTVGVEAHTHEFIATAHEDQKFGFSLAGGAAFAGGGADPRRGRARPQGPALAHRLADLRHQRLRGGRAPGAGVAGADPRRPRGRAGRARPRRRLRHRVHHPGRPVDRRRPGQADQQDRRVASASWPRCASRGCRSSRAGRSSGRPCSPSTRSARSRTSTASAPTSASTAG